MAASIKDALQIDAELLEGSNGIFDIAVDGRVVFSKQAEQRFPEHEEIIKRIVKVNRLQEE